MTPKQIDELVLGARYLVVPTKGLVVRKTPRVSLATDGEVVELDVYWFRRAQSRDVDVFDVPVAQVAPAEEPPTEAPTEPTPELEQSAAKNKRARAQGDS